MLLADNALIQVHANGIRHIRPDQRTSEWKSPSKKIIQMASANSRQVCIYSCIYASSFYAYVCMNMCVCVCVYVMYVCVHVRMCVYV